MSLLLTRSWRLRKIFLFFFNDTATTEIYTLSLHDALPISPVRLPRRPEARGGDRCERGGRGVGGRGAGGVLPMARGGTPPPRAPRADPRGAPVVPGAQRAAGPLARLAPGPAGLPGPPPGPLLPS